MWLLSGLGNFIFLYSMVEITGIFSKFVFRKVTVVLSFGLAANTWCTWWHFDIYFIQDVIDRTCSIWILLQFWLKTKSWCQLCCHCWHQTLKWKCHFDEFFITGCTGSCHFDNFQCSQWWKFHQYDNIFIGLNDLWCNQLATKLASW